jgi:hypothetical protein
MQLVTYCTILRLKRLSVEQGIAVLTLRGGESVVRSGHASYEPPLADGRIKRSEPSHVTEAYA